MCLPTDLSIFFYYNLFYHCVLSLCCMLNNYTIIYLFNLFSLLYIYWVTCPAGMPCGVIRHPLNTCQTPCSLVKLVNLMNSDSYLMKVREVRETLHASSSVFFSQRRIPLCLQANGHLQMRCFPKLFLSMCAV